jgi:electron transfer flavoprotein beta subunit
VSAAAKGTVSPAPFTGALRVLACFKVTPDFEALRAADWAAAATHGVETRYARRILNCFDESALEMALRLSDTLAGRGVPVELRALSVGGREVEPFLQTLVALGFEQAARVDTGNGSRSAAAGPGGGAAGSDNAAAGSDDAASGPGGGAAGPGGGATDLDFAPGVVASIIAAYVKRDAPCDLLLLGCRSGPGDSGTLPFRVAEKLGWPCLTQVTEVEPLGDGRLRVACAADGGTLRLTLRGPCVLAVGNALIAHLRVPTLQDRLAHRDAAIGVLSAADLGLDLAAELRREAIVLTGLEAIDRGRRGAVVSGDTPADEARALFDSCLRDLIERL